MTQKEYKKIVEKRIKRICKKATEMAHSECKLDFDNEAIKLLDLLNELCEFVESNNDNIRKERQHEN